MRIERIEAIPFTLPYAKPFTMATGTISEAAHVLIRIHAEGLVGVAEACSRPMIYGESQESIVAAVERWFAPDLVGHDVFRLDAAQLALRSVAANETVKGALDLAIHDLRGKALGQPVWELLGAAAPRLRLTRMLSMGTPGEVAAEAGSAQAEHGIGSFKVKVDRDVDLGAAVLRAVRETVGPSATVYADANQSLDAASAIRLCRAVDELAIEFLEEPVAATDFTGRAAVAAASGIPILVDESARTVEEAGLQITAGSARAISIKTARTGYTESLRILGLAQGLHCRTVIGSQGDSAIGAITGATFGAAMGMTSRESAELDYFLGLTDQLVAEQPRIVDGEIEANTVRHGTGVVIDDDKLRHYRTDRL
jgi:L-alanine-DL-glutamate epimerase-like enolase superfamily enzyme